MISAGAALVFYQENSQQTSLSQKYVAELNSALSSYRKLDGSFNSSVKDYGSTLLLLTDAVENLNTSTPAYRNASIALGSLWESYRSLASVNGRAPGVSVNLMVDYGNGTRVWYNDTTAPPGLNAYAMSVLLLGGRLGAVWYPQFGEHFIEGVNGVNGTSSKSWFVWGSGPGGWVVSGTGADGITVVNGTTYALWYCGFDSNYNPVCTR